MDRIFGVELPQLAREVQRIENIRNYVGELQIQISARRLSVIVYILVHER